MADSTFPTSEDKARIKLLGKYEKMIEGEHLDVFGLKDVFSQDKEKTRLIYIAVNLPSMIAEYYADKVAGSEIGFEFEDEAMQKASSRIAEDNHLDTKTYEVSVDQAAFGFGVLRLRRGDDQKAKIEQIPTTQYFPEFSKDMESERRKVKLGSIVTLRDKIMNTVKDYWFFIVYERIEGVVYEHHELWEMNADQEAKKQVDVSIMGEGYIVEPQRTEFSVIPVWQIDNMKRGGKTFGKSDLKDAEPLFAELNDRFTQISVELIKNLKAKMAVPRDTLDKDGQVKASEADMIEIGDGDFVPKYITNENPLIEQGFSQIKQVLYLIAALTSIPPEKLGLEAKGGAEKVEAIRVRYHDLVSRITRKRKYFNVPLKQLMREALKIEKIAGIKDDTSCHVIFDDPLPVDEGARSTRIIGEYKGGLKSRRTAISELQGIEGTELDDEVKRIEEDETPAVPSFASQTPRVNRFRQEEPAN